MHMDKHRRDPPSSRWIAWERHGQESLAAAFPRLLLGRRPTAHALPSEARLSGAGHAFLARPVVSSPSRRASGPGSSAAPEATRGLHPIPLATPTTPSPPPPSLLSFPFFPYPPPFPAPVLCRLPPFFPLPPLHSHIHGRPWFLFSLLLLACSFLAASTTYYLHTHIHPHLDSSGHTALFLPRNLALHRQCARLCPIVPEPCIHYTTSLLHARTHARTHTLPHPYTHPLSLIPCIAACVTTHSHNASSRRQLGRCKLHPPHTAVF